MAVITSRVLSESTDSLLRFAMRADATLCAGAGLFVAMAADPLSRLVGLSAAVQFLVGAALVGYGALLYVLAAVPDIRRIGIGIVVANVAFAVAAVSVLAAGWHPLTPFGVTATLAFVGLTLALAELQYVGVRRLA